MRGDADARAACGCCSPAARRCPPSWRSPSSRRHPDPGAQHPGHDRMRRRDQHRAVLAPRAARVRAACRCRSPSVQAIAHRRHRVRAGETGMLRVRGPNVGPGYTDARRNAGTFSDDGWLITGDIGHVDAEGPRVRDRPRQGRDHPRRPQHRPRPDRGGAAAPPRRADSPRPSASPTNTPASCRWRSSSLKPGATVTRERAARLRRAAHRRAAGAAQAHRGAAGAAADRDRQGLQAGAARTCDRARAARAAVRAMPPRRACRSPCSTKPKACRPPSP